MNEYEAHESSYDHQHKKVSFVSLNLGGEKNIARLAGPLYFYIDSSSCFCHLDLLFVAVFFRYRFTHSSFSILTLSNIRPFHF